MSQRGFTLLEVLVALAILGIALTALLASQRQSLSIAEQSDLYVRATLLAREKMAESLAVGLRPGAYSGDFGDRYPGYHWQVTVTDADFSVIPLLRSVTGMLYRVRVTILTDWQHGPLTLDRLVLRRDP